MSNNLDRNFMVDLLLNGNDKLDGLIESGATPQIIEALLTYEIVNDNRVVVEKLINYIPNDSLYKFANFVKSYGMLKLFFDKGLNVENLLKEKCSVTVLLFLLDSIDLILKGYEYNYFDLKLISSIEEAISGISKKSDKINSFILITLKLYLQNRHKIRQKKNDAAEMVRYMLFSNSTVFNEEILSLSVDDPCFFKIIKSFTAECASKGDNQKLLEIKNVFKDNEQLYKELFKDALFYVKEFDTAEFLLEAGASTDIRDMFGETPLEKIQRNSNLYKNPQKLISLISTAHENSRPGDNVRFQTRFINLNEIKPLIVGKHFKISYKRNEYFIEQSFVTSMSKSFGFNPNFFTYFSPEEIFERLVLRYGDEKYFLTFDEKEKVALSVLKSDKIFLPANYTINVIEGSPLFKSSFYHKGIYYAEMLLRESDNDFKVGNNIFESRMLICYSVDGYKPIEVYPGFLKKDSDTLIYVMDRNFSTELSVSKIGSRNFSQFVKNLNLHSASVARDCLIKSYSVPASVNECLNMIKMLSSSLKDDLAVHKLNDSFEQYIGDPCEYYGITSLKNIKVNIRHMLPVRCSVHDLIMFAAEMVSHSNLKMVNFFEVYRHIGKLMSKSYDLERIFPLQAAS